MEIILVSLGGMVVFGGLFLVLCPEWWSTSLGTLKEDKLAGKAGEAPAAQSPQADALPASSPPAVPDGRGQADNRPAPR